ncbi:MAG TPA: hypothetical protein VKB96_13580 [Gammaproteobacteria bacterium]|nr:hypothetical protein [Gammaproteobacteria bacterium]
MDELEQARRARDEAFDNFMHHARLETKHSVQARRWRSEHLRAAEEVRALERDLLAVPITI